MSKLKKMNKEELKHWCKVYRADYNQAIKDLGDKEKYSTEDVSTYLYNKIIKSK